MTEEDYSKTWPNYLEARRAAAVAAIEVLIDFVSSDPVEQERTRLMLIERIKRRAVKAGVPKSEIDRLLKT